jgi:hypothetical protein
MFQVNNLVIKYKENDIVATLSCEQASFYSADPFEHWTKAFMVQSSCTCVLSFVGSWIDIQSLQIMQSARIDALCRPK